MGVGDFTVPSLVVGNGAFKKKKKNLERGVCLVLKFSVE